MVERERQDKALLRESEHLLVELTRCSDRIERYSADLAAEVVRLKHERESPDA